MLRINATSLKNAQRRVSAPYVLLSIVYLAGLFIRLTSIRQELHPYQFCDEGIFSGEVTRLLTSRTLSTIEFRSGGFNIYPVLFSIKVISGIFNIAITPNAVVIFGRILLPIILGTATAFPIYGATKIWTGSKKLGLVSASLFVFSPFTIAQAHIWYPDAYLMFFSASSIYFLIKKHLKGWTRRDYLFTAITLGMAISTKYTALILVVPFAYSIYIDSRRKGLNPKASKNLKISFFTLVSIGLALNFSIFFHFRFLITGVHSDEKIYKIADYFRISGIFFYFANALFLTLSISGSILIVIGIRHILKQEKDRILVRSILYTPLFYLIFMGLSRQVLNRNIDIYIPLICIIATIGVGRIFEAQGSNIIKFSLLGIAVLPMLTQSGYAIAQDTKIDSRVLAHQWLSNNLSRGTAIGINLGCSEQSPADGLGFRLVPDEDMSTNQNYYVYVSYWNNPVLGYYESSSIFQEWNMKYLHFYHFNDSNLIKWRSGKTKISQYVPSGYSLIKIFNSNGPDVLVIRKR